MTFRFHTAYEIWHQSDGLIDSVPVLFQVTMTEESALGDSFLTSVQNAAQMKPNLDSYILCTWVQNAIDRDTYVPTTIM